MSIGAILTLGYGTFGAVNLLPTLGYNVGAAIVVPSNSGGGIPSRRRRVYIKVDGRTVFFKNEDNAIAFLRDQQAETEKRVNAYVERKAIEYAKVEPKPLPALAPLPRIVVRGSDDGVRMAQDFDKRMRQLLGMLEAQIRAELDEDDEIMLLH